MKKLFAYFTLLFAILQFVEAQPVPQDTGNGNNKILWTQNFPGLVRDCAFMPDENYIIIAAQDTALQVRRTVDDSLVREKIIKEGIITSLDVSKDGKYVAIGGGSILKLLDINTFDVIKDYKKGSTESVSLSPDGKMLAYVGADTINPQLGKAFVINVETGEQNFKFGLPDTTPPWIYGPDVKNTKFSPDGKYLVCDWLGGNDKKIYVFDTDSFKLYCTFNDDDTTPNGSDGEPLIFSPNSQYLLVPNIAGYSFRIWDLISKEEKLNEIIPTDCIPIFFHDNKTLFLTRYFKQQTYFYDINKKLIVKTLDFSAAITNELVFNTNDTRLLGIGLCLIQIDTSVLSVTNPNNTNTEDIIKPNPATGNVTINVNLPLSDNTSINLYGLAGNFISNVWSGFKQQGLFEINYNCSQLAAGTYFIRIMQKDFSKTLKLVKE